jgi:transcriptional antiterminator NusG
MSETQSPPLADEAPNELAAVDATGAEDAVLAEEATLDVAQPASPEIELRGEEELQSPEEPVTETAEMDAAVAAPDAQQELEEELEADEELQVPAEPVTATAETDAAVTVPDAEQELQEEELEADEELPSPAEPVTATVETDAAVAAPDEEQELQGEEPEAEEEEQPEEIDDDRAWYVVHSYSGYENKVKNNLDHRIESMNMQDKIFQVVVPTEEEIEIREGHRRRTKKRVFPGYILVQMILDEESWYVVRNTPGVTGFVGSGTKPTSLRPDEVTKIFKRMEMEAPKIKVSFREGQTVRIVDGPFADFVGVVEDLNLDKGKVTVMVAFFGRETPVELDFLQVQKQ